MQIYDFLIRLVETFLNYGALGIALGELFFIWYMAKNFDFTRRKKS